MTNNRPKVAISTVEITAAPPLISGKFADYKPANLTATTGGLPLSESETHGLNRLNYDLRRRMTNYQLAQSSPAGRPEAGTNSLVQRRKSPTRPNRQGENFLKDAAISRFLRHLKEKRPEVYQQTAAAIGAIEPPEKRVIVQEAALWSENISSFGGVNPETGEVTGANYYRSPVARLSYRRWSDEFRLRVEVDPNPAEPPPEQGGDRVTNTLSQRGAKNILESGAYVSAVRGGFTTFLTLTFAPDARQRIVNGDSTIGAEVARFFDAAQKMYQRGWDAAPFITDTRNGFDCISNDFEKVPAATDKLDYIWVAEAPKNDAGEVNPHCHILMRWSVEPHLFRAWANRIENIWGHGFAKLERIRSHKAAGDYLLKALGYLTKGEKGEQGEIRGNRYNISKPARAPGWECIAEFHAQHMAAIIAEVGEKLQRRAAPIRGDIAATKQQIEEAARASAVLKNQGNLTNAATVRQRLAKLEQRLKDNYAQLAQIPARVNDHYQITFKTPQALAGFMEWAAGARFWGSVPKISRLLPPLIDVKRWSAGIQKARAKYRHLWPRLEEKAALWPQLLRETWRCEAPETDHQPGIYQEYCQWISTN